jgi:hypothetical protein
MPLDKVLIKHLDDQDELEARIEEDIETLVSGLNINELIDSPESSLMQIVDDLQEILKSEYYPLASQNGIELARAIEDDGDIQVPDSNNPNLNEGILDGDDGKG